MNRYVCPLCTVNPAKANAKDATCDSCRGSQRMFPVNFIPRPALAAPGSATD